MFEKFCQKLGEFQFFLQKNPAKPHNHNSSGTGRYRAGIFGNKIYMTTCLVRNCVRTFSEKYLPISPECMRSAKIFGGTAEY
jgi:hypothetical protein